MFTMQGAPQLDNCYDDGRQVGVNITATNSLEDVHCVELNGKLAGKQHEKEESVEDEEGTKISGLRKNELESCHQA